LNLLFLATSIQANQIGTDQASKVMVTPHNPINNTGVMNSIINISFYPEGKDIAVINNSDIMTSNDYSNDENIQGRNHTLNNDSQKNQLIPTSPVPESATILLLGLSLFIIAIVSKKKLK